MATARKKIKLIKYLTGIFCCLMIIGLTGFYVWQISAGISEKYQARSLQTEIAKLKTENQHLKAGVANLKSMSKVQEFAFSQEMLESDKTVYLPITTSEVAINK